MPETVAVPEKPPVGWLYNDPKGYIDGQTLVVDYDGSLWGEPGRACGIVQPPPGRRYVGGGNSHGHPIPDRYPDETFSDAMPGSAQFIDDNGKVVQRQVGAIAMEGGHSNQAPDFAVLAETGNLRDRIRGAVDWLQRQGKYAHLANDLAVYGRYSRVQSGPARGAIIFRGAAYPWLTHADAMTINSRASSSEQWSHPDFGGKSQFLGVATVARSSYRNDVPAVLADLGDDDPMGIIMWLEDNTDKEPEADDMAPAAVMAEVEQPEFDAQTNRIDALETRLDGIESMLSSFIISQTSGDDLTLDNRVDVLHQRLPQIEETLVSVLEKLQQLTETPPEDSLPASPLLTQ